jgi:DNA-directed RNA polymerase alpha subunit
MTEISDLELSIRATNALANLHRWGPHRSEIRSISDLTRLTRGELMRTPNFARKLVDEVEAALAKRGLRLRNEGESLTNPWFEFAF